MLLLFQNFQYWLNWWRQTPVEARCLMQHFPSRLSEPNCSSCRCNSSRGPEPATLTPTVSLHPHPYKPVVRTRLQTWRTKTPPPAFSWQRNPDWQLTHSSLISQEHQCCCSSRRKEPAELTTPPLCHLLHHQLCWLLHQLSFLGLVSIGQLICLTEICLSLCTLQRTQQLLKWKVHRISLLQLQSTSPRELI